jgi:hypothetical protein
MNVDGEPILLGAGVIASSVMASTASGSDAGINALVGMAEGERPMQHCMAPECDLDGAEWHPR